jgi:hypothetical protein
MPLPVALTIAGSDPSGGAGIQADLKTFHQFGVYGAAAVTLVTVQNTLRVDRVECLDPELVRAQIRAVVEDIRPMAAKTGALGSRANVEAVADEAAGFDFPLVVDPVMISKHGLPLMAAEARAALVERLIPTAFLLTPNLPEAAALAGIEIVEIEDMRRAAQSLAAMGARRCWSRADTCRAMPSICCGRLKAAASSARRASRRDTLTVPAALIPRRSRPNSRRARRWKLPWSARRPSSRRPSVPIRGWAAAAVRSIIMPGGSSEISRSADCGDPKVLNPIAIRAGRRRIGGQTSHRTRARVARSARVRG